MKQRLDLLMVQKGLAPSRAKAQELIDRGSVRVWRGKNEILKPKASDALDSEAAKIELSPEDPLLNYVSRGGLKLAAALVRLKISAESLFCLDVGISTGGFADALLQRGASRVDGIDVGEGQLAEKLHSEPRLRSFEKLHVRELSDHPILKNEKYNLIVVDVSFISLENVLPLLYDFILPDGFLLALVKPQFELDASQLTKKGIVRDSTSHNFVEEKIKALARKVGLQVLDYFPCEEKGRDGNQEFFVYAKK